MKLRCKLSFAEQVSMFIPCLPPALKPTVDALFKAGQLGIPKSYSTYYRYQLVLMASLILFNRSQVQEETAMYLFVDSSPYLGRDWFAVKMRTICLANLIDLSGIVNVLSDRIRQVFGQEESEDNHDDAYQWLGPLQHKSCSDMYRRLLASIRTSTLLPVTFALGHTSLADKVAALMFVIAMEYGSLKMHPVCKQVVSTTTDFGVEWGVAEFSSVNLRHLMPKWLISTAMEPDTEQDGDAVGPWQWDRLFENALRISGVLHIIDNATKQVNKRLNWWGSYYKWLKALESVLADKQRLRF